MWNPAEHTNQENLQWSWLRALEWQNWPIFISQPIVPIMFYFYKWYLVIGIIVLVSFMWQALIVPFFVSPTALFYGVIFDKLKYLTTLIMAFLVFYKYGIMLTILTLVWPFICALICGWILILPLAILSLTKLGKESQTGKIQEKIINEFGYVKNNFL